MISGLQEDYTDLGKSLKASSHNIAAYESYDQDLIESSLRKSYIFQMSGSKKKPIFEKPETNKENMQQSLLRSQAPKKMKVTEVIEEKEEEEDGE